MSDEKSLYEGIILGLKEARGFIDGKIRVQELPKKAGKTSDML